MAPTDNQVAAVKALASQAGSGPAARQSLIASGALTKLVKHLSSKKAAIVSQSALALSLLASDPTTRPSVWEHRKALVPALVQSLKTGGPLTLARSLTTLAVLLEHIPEAGAAVIKAKGVVPILHIAQTGPQGPREAALSALGAIVNQPGGLEAFWRGGGVEWALTSLRTTESTELRVEAATLLRAGVEARRSETPTAIPIAKLAPVVRVALTPPDRPGSQQAMRLLCFLVGDPGAMSSQRGDDNVLAELARQGALEAAVMHFRLFPSPPAKAGSYEPSGLWRREVALFLCWMCFAPEVFPQLQSAGALEVLLDLSRMDEGEGMYAKVAVVSLALSYPAACAPLRKLGAITPLAQRLKDPSNEDIDIATLALTALTRDETGEGPAPQTVGDLLAAGAVPALLRLLAVNTSSGARCLLLAYDLLHLISLESPGLAAIAATRCSDPLVTALAAASWKEERPELPSEILGMITNLVEGRPGQGLDFLSAGIGWELAKCLRSPRAEGERELAMDLVEKLVHCGPGAGDTLAAQGPMELILDMAVAPASFPRPGTAPECEETLRPTPAVAVTKAQSADANALLSRIFADDDDAAETATGVGEPVRAMQGQGQADGDPRAKAMASISSEKECRMCGVVSEKHLHKCSRCRKARYCNQECQRAHWPIHKLECRGCLRSRGPLTGQGC